MKSPRVSAMKLVEEVCADVLLNMYELKLK